PLQALSGDGKIIGQQQILEDQVAQLTAKLIRAEQELTEKTLQIEKLRDKNFKRLGMAVHCLRNPASGILSAAEYLIEDTAQILGPEHAVVLQSVHASSTFLLQAIDNVLNVSSMECGKLKLEFRSTDLLILVQQALALNELSSARRAVRIRISSDREVLMVRVDPLKITQVIDNLLSNAIKFSNRGSSVEIRVEVQAKRVYLAVKDQGLGISADRLTRIFEPFESAEPDWAANKSGMGLGLTVSKRIIEAHAGEISVVSNPGIGSTFTIALPIRPAPKRI
ncbi:MAG: HAMP domain-containing histidine kinase, partial [Acidobacteriaceae bacterium]|nr:HAMP domain-containing histidine kinase [Acidobacteriaceae bacterium]